jgi:hypothetical protein
VKTVVIQGVWLFIPGMILDTWQLETLTWPWTGNRMPVSKMTASMSSRLPLRSWVAWILSFRMPWVMHSVEKQEDCWRLIREGMD